MEMIHVIPCRRVNGFISIRGTCGENKTKYSISELSGKTCLDTEVTRMTDRVTLICT